MDLYTKFGKDEFNKHNCESLLPQGKTWVACRSRLKDVLFPKHKYNLSKFSEQEKQIILNGFKVHG